MTLTEKGTLGVCNASKERNYDLVVTVSDKVHRSCRDPSYINKKNIRSHNKKKSSTFADGIASRRSLRADHDFNFKLDCLFCKNRITEKELRTNKAYQVMCMNLLSVSLKFVRNVKINGQLM